ncbi:MAG: cyclic nucleotide-binding domain-containing protein [Bacteroidota bacterium]
MPDASLWLRDALVQHEDAFTQTTLETGACLFREGDEPDALYVVQAGVLDVLVGDPPETVDRIREGGVVGEMGLLTSQPRTATIRAAEPSTLFRLAREAFDRLRDATPEMERALAETAVPRWQRVLLSNALSRLFDETTDLVARHDLQERVPWHTLESGEAICRQGDEGHSMYVIVSGRVLFEVERGDGSVHVVGEAGAGEAVGEFSLLTGAPRSASVVAARQTSYVEIDRELFTELVAAHPGVMFALTRQLAERQRRAHSHGLASLAPPTLTVTLVPTRPGLSIRPLAKALTDELGRIGTARLIDVRAAEEALGAGVATTCEDDPLHAVVVQWLNEQEAETDYLVFLADEEWTPWTRRCLSRADRALFVGRAAEPTPPSETERRLADSDSRVDRHLVLWHAPETEAPSGTARWLDPRPGYRHYHVREGDPAHLARLARHVADVAVGLVLGGGGARGYAHFGVFRAMEEVGLPIDYIGGASFGAMIGALRATDRPLSGLLDACEQFASNRVVFDRTLPVVALNASHHLTQLCHTLYSDRLVEDLWLPFFAMGVNLTRGEPVVIRRGPLWRAIRMSISVPGVFAPVVENGELMVDGGVLNNFPVNVMREESGSERIIGALIQPGGTRPREYDMETGVSGWRAMWRRLNPFVRSPRLPYLSRVITRTLFVGSAPLSESNVRLADLVLPLDIHASLLDFAPYRRIADEGYEQSIGPLREWAARQPDLARPEPVPAAEPPALRAERVVA